MTPRFILVVEDDEDVATTVVETLKTTWPPDTVDYVTVGTLQDATTIMQAYVVDIILLDLSLPDSQSDETLKTVVELCRQQLHTVIVVLSGGITMVDGYNAMSDGADDFVMKGAPDTYLNTVKKLTTIVTTAWVRHLGFLKRCTLAAAQNDI